MTEQTFKIVTCIVGILGGTVALVTLIRSVAEYIRQGRQKRIEFYFQQEKVLLENDNFSKIRTFLRSKDPDDIKKLRNIPKINRSDFAGFFENIAMLVEGQQLPKTVACYMFSYDAISCWECNDFWHDIQKDDHHWCVLKKFVEEMKELRPKMPSLKSKLSF